jgi:hypothetical protein
MNKMSAVLLCILIFMAFSYNAVYAQSRAVFRQVTGKVEVMPPNAGWQSARVGMTISPGTIISTGVRSSAVIEMDNSMLTVKALSRVTLEDLSRQGDEINTGLYLRSGRVEADVTPQEGLKHNYRLRSPITTASVRGTIFSSLVKALLVKKGLVVMRNLINRGGSAGEGEGVWTTTGLDMHTSEEDSSRRAEVDVFTGAEPFHWTRLGWFNIRGQVGANGDREAAGGSSGLSATLFFYLAW